MVAMETKVCHVIKLRTSFQKNFIVGCYYIPTKQEDWIHSSIRSVHLLTLALFLFLTVLPTLECIA